jgi:hypothetical protein
MLRPGTVPPKPAFFDPAKWPAARFLTLRGFASAFQRCS